MKSVTFILPVFLLLSPLRGWTCQILNSKGQAAPVQTDFLFQTLAATARCPRDVRELKDQFAARGAAFTSALVANRGFHNSSAGSFSFFEKVTGASDVFFGHFTTLKSGEVGLDQSLSRGKLLVELIAWDPLKGYYNFYELVGTSSQESRWFYRGDSADILKDNRYLHLDPPAGEKKFGTTLRCSACHASGGPIMKELAAPHNDWWTTSRPLPMGKPSPEVKTWLAQLSDAGDFANEVKSGILKLEASAGYQNLKSKQSLQEQLRPLFCDQEINLESATDLGGDVQIPAGFFLNPLLASSAENESLPRTQYEQLLAKYKLRFPETGRRDADHAWLTPVKGFSDLLAIETLVAKGVVNADEVRRILDYDKTNPILSAKRCGLLKNLRSLDLNDLVQTPAASASPTSVEDAFAKLLRVRRGVFESEISQNPLGQILEPGFRVIFPEPQLSN